MDDDPAGLDELAGVRLVAPYEVQDPHPAGPGMDPPLQELGEQACLRALSRAVPPSLVTFLR